MTHPQRFLESILANPADDAPRLSYANWLDSCGNPLGEFIRLQCLPVGAKHLQSERREQTLLARHQADWSQSMVDCIDWCCFRRGFIEEIALSDWQLIEHSRVVFGQAPVLDIHLQTTGKHLHQLPEILALPQTIFLDLSGQRLGDESMSRLADAPMLARVHGLNLGSNTLGDDGFEHLFDSPHLGALRELYVNDNPITDEGIRRFVMSPIVERLDRLDMRYTDVTEEGAAILRHILGANLLYEEE